MRYLAIDLGDKRTGLACGDDLTRIATPWRVVEVPLDRQGGEDLLVALAAACAEYFGPREHGAVVVGLPLNMDGTEGPRAKLCRSFAQRLGARIALPVHLHDERMTTDEAIRRLGGSGLSHAQKKARRDAIAAAATLEDFLATHPPESNEARP